MMNIAFAALVGVAYLIYRYLTNKRANDRISLLSEGIKFECLNYSKAAVIAVGFLMILPIGSFIYALTTKDNDLIAIFLAFVFLFLAEWVNLMLSLRFYYNDTSCIINNKIVQYKSIKTIIKRVGNPLGRYTLITYSGEKLSIFRAPLNIILEKTKLKVSN